MLVDSVMSYFDECEIALANKFVPYYCSSIACHLLNLENQRREFAIEQGRVAQFRMHMFFTAPPGFSKSMMLQMFLRGRHSVLGTTGVETGFEGFLSEAGYTGTIKNVEGEIQTVYGAAHEHRKGILGIDEFAVLGNVMQTDYGKSLDTALLTSLDSGMLEKRLANGKISYTTQLTLWSGSQPTRFDLSSGLGRRLFFIFFVPTQEEEQLIRQARRRKGIKPTDKTLAKINDSILNIKGNLSIVENIEYGDTLYDFLDEQDVPHYEELPYERMAVGHHIATHESLDSTITVELDDELERLMKQEVMWRNQIKKGPEISQVEVILGDRGIMRFDDLIKKLMDFGLTYEQSSNVIRHMSAHGIVTISREKTPGPGRGPRVVSLNE